MNAVEHAKNAIRKKAEAMCASAVGKDFSVREDRRTVIRGKITKCEVARVVVNGCNVYAVWSIWINNVYHFEVRRIPS